MEREGWMDERRIEGKEGGDKRKREIEDSILMRPENTMEK